MMAGAPTRIRASVVIATYGRDAVLAHTIRSIIRVLTPEDELIIVDQTERHDADTSAFIRTLNRYAGVRYVRQRVASVPLARNVAARLARGAVMVFVDDDVLVEPGFIDAHLSYYDDPQVGAVAGHSYAPNGRPYFVEGGEYATKLVGANMSLRRDVLFAIGGFDTNIFSTLREDGECGERLVRHGWKIANGRRASLVHLAASAGGAGGRQRSSEWYRKTYHNYMYAFLKRSPVEIVVGFPRYVLGTLRHRVPSPSRLLQPQFLFGTLILGHVQGIRTRLLGVRGPYLTQSSPDLSLVADEPRATASGGREL